MMHKYVGETGIKNINQGRSSTSLGNAITKNQAERILLESHKEGGRVGDQQRGHIKPFFPNMPGGRRAKGGCVTRAMGGGMGPNSGPYSTPRSKGGRMEERDKKLMGGLINNKVLNKTGKKIDSGAKDVGQKVEGAGKHLVKGWKSAGAGMRDAAKDVGRGVKSAYKDVSRGAKSAYKDASKDVRGAAKYVKRGATSMANDARRGMNKAGRSVAKTAKRGANWFME